MPRPARTTRISYRLPPALSARLREEASHQGKPPESIAREWLAERLAPSPDMRARDAARGALQAAGLLIAEPIDDALRARPAGPEPTVEMVGAALERTGGRPLSAIIIEQRGPTG